MSYKPREPQLTQAEAFRQAEERAGYSMAEFAERWSRIEAESALIMGPSLAELVALAEHDKPGTLERIIAEVGPDGWRWLAYEPGFWLRQKQQAIQELDGEVLLVVGGRGGGKTKQGVGWLIKRFERGARDVVLVGPSDGDIEQYMLGGYKRPVEGDLSGSGLLDSLPPWIKHEWRRKDGVILIDWYGRTITVHLHSAHVVEFRGPNPDTVWCDEVIKYRFPEKLLSNLRLATRSKGRVEPQILITTSPKRLRFLRDLVMDPDCTTIHGMTTENRGNVTDRWMEAQHRRLAGTRQGQEELEGRLFGDDGSGMFSLDLIDKHRVSDPPELDLCVVAIDPSASTNRRADETGMLVVARCGDIERGHAYLLEDATGRHAWESWGDLAYVLAEKHGASAFVVERNKYADAVAANLRAAGARRGYESVKRPGTKHLTDMVHPRTGKRIQIVEVLAMGDKVSRAGPVSTLYEAGRVHHVGHFAKLETEMSEYDPMTSDSPNGLDALVHGATELFRLDRPAEANARVGFRGMTEALAQVNAQPSEKGRAPTPTGGAGGLSSLLAQLQRGHWGSRL